MELILRIKNPTEVDLAALIAAESVGCNFDDIAINNEGENYYFASVTDAAKIILEVRETVSKFFN